MIHPSFTTIDITTAAGDPAIGIVRYYHSQVAWKWDGTAFPEIAPFLYEHLHEQTVVGWEPAARESIEAAFQSSGLDYPEGQWHDYQKVPQRFWPECCVEDYALAAAAHRIRHPY